MYTLKPSSMWTPSLNCDGSLSEFIFNAFKAQPKDNVCQVNGLNKKSQTFGEVLNQATAVASGLQKLGIQPEDVIAIVDNYSENSIAATLGSIFQGAPPFPMDPSMKQMEFDHMFRIAKPKLVFVVARKLKEAKEALRAIGSQAHIYLLDGKLIGGEDSSIHPFEAILDVNIDVESFKALSIVRAEQVAAIIPSSGTTGLPKGVTISHRALLLQLDMWVESAWKTPCLQLTPLFWISGFGVLLFSSVTGNKRIYLTEKESTNILHAIDTCKVEWGIFAPIYLARTLNDHNFKNYDLSSLKIVCVGGSTVPNSTIALTKELLPNVKFTQAYGATELSGLITIPFDDRNAYSAGMIHPIHDFKIVDVSTGEEVEALNEGELLIKSPTLMVGYINNEEATKSAIDADGYYHTGDIGRFDDAGFLYITGRNKELFKVKNHQLAPAELEDVIRGIPGVDDVAVVGIPHEIDQNHPRALVVKDANASLTEEQIVAEVADKLSDSKHLFGGAQFVDSLPRTTTGKLLRGELLKLVKY